MEYTDYKETAKDVFTRADRRTKDEAMKLLVDLSNTEQLRSLLAFMSALGFD